MLDNIHIIIIYLGIGICCGVCFEILMAKFGMNDTTSNFERFTWVLFWPMYVILFLIGTRD
jgi:uncharacterized membrane protein